MLLSTQAPTPADPLILAAIGVGLVVYAVLNWRFHLTSGVRNTGREAIGLEPREDRPVDELLSRVISIGLAISGLFLLIGAFRLAVWGPAG